MKKPTETELKKESWKRIISFYKNNHLMSKVVDYILKSKINTLLYASTSLQMLNISTDRKKPSRLLRIDASDVKVNLDYFKKNQLIESKHVSEEEAFIEITIELKRMLKDK